MAYFARRQGREGRRRRPGFSGWIVESLEGRTLLSAASGASPTLTVLHITPTAADSAQTVTLVAVVQNATNYNPISEGKVKFVVISPTHSVLNTIPMTSIGEAGFATTSLVKTGTYELEADYISANHRIASSVSAPVTIPVSPLSVAGFRVTPRVHHGRLNEPLTFTVTALTARDKVDTDYTGTIAFSSPTDSWTVFPTQVYVSLGLPAPPAESTGLATFPNQEYTFTPADDGSHTFVGGVTFEKGGAEVLKVTQADDDKAQGKATIAIS